MRLPSPSVPALVRGPERTSQFVVEFVGPRTVPAAQAAELLRPDWRAALGSPELWILSPADVAWQPLRALTSGSYDSIALAWDFATPAGTMSRESATHLVGLAERFANPMGRRAIPLTALDDVPKAIVRLKKLQEGLDAGLSVLLVAPRPVAVSEFGRELQARGLERDPEGWAWKSAEHPEPLFQAIPFEEPVSDGLTLGFRLARCPDPGVAIEGIFSMADSLARTGLAAFDEDRRPLTTATREGIRHAVRAGAQALESVGLRPGSWSAIKTFV